MEAASISSAPPAPGFGATIRKFVDRYGLIIVLLAMPVAFGIQDLIKTATSSTSGPTSRTGSPTAPSGR